MAAISPTDPNETIRIADPDDIAPMAAMASASGYGHITVLLEAVRTGLIGLLVPTDRLSCLGGRPQLRRCGTPTIVLVGDDHFEQVGPSGWACSYARQKWATKATVHGAAATLTAYREAVYTCLAVGKLVLVETSSTHIQPWASLFTDATPPVPIDLIVATDGQHPRTILRSEMQ